jgi:hypothetical protein
MISPDTEFRLNLPPILGAGDYAGGLEMACEQTDTAIEKIIASCDGNMRGALEALLRVNEFLEAELQQLYATISQAPTGLETVH